MFYNVGYANQEIKEKINTYFLNFSSLSASFFQFDSNNTQEGNIFINDERIRIEYNKPEDILIIFSKIKNSKTNL